MFDPEVFKMKDGMLMFTKAAKREPDKRSVVDMSPGVYGKGGLEFMSSERSGRT